MKPSCVVFLVRHGQSVWNAEGRLQGQTADIPLTQRGIDQSRVAARTLAASITQPAALWSSDLVRARQTADIISDELVLPVHIDPRLREQTYGTLEGGPVVDDLPDHDGESFDDVRDRISSFLTDVCASGPRQVIVVSHGDTIRAALTVLGTTPTWEVPPANGSVQIVDVSPEGPSAMLRAPVNSF